MKVYEVIYAVGGIAYGGFNRAKIITHSVEQLQGLLNEQEGEVVRITSITELKEDTTAYKCGQILSVNIA